MNKISPQIKKYFILVAWTILLTSCNVDKTPVKPNSTGKAGEILIVINDDYWESKVGDTIFYSLGQPFPILPQDEAYFDVAQVNKRAFKNIFQTHRNIFIVKIGAKYPETKIEIFEDKWAKSQLIYYFYAPSDTSFMTLWHNNIDNIVQNVFDTEMVRYKKAYQKYQNNQAKKQIEEKFNISLDLVSEYNVDVLEDHFCWISRETNVSSQGILIYDYPYTDTNTFTTDYIVQKRNEIGMKKVPGQTEGSYMQTETRVPIISEQFYLNNNYAYMLRGLWYIENYNQGGPFVSVSVLDEKRNRVVCADAYVYAGKKNKKLYIWQVESILRTLKIL